MQQTLNVLYKLDGRWYQRISIEGKEKIRVVSDKYVRQNYRDLYNKQKDNGNEE